jgi:integrase
VHELLKIADAALQWHWLEALVQVALNTGMREGELLALKWRDVDLTCGAIQVTHNRTRAEHGYVDGATKTKASQARTVLSETALAAVREQSTRVKAERLRIWGSGGTTTS